MGEVGKLPDEVLAREARNLVPNTVTVFGGSVGDFKMKVSLLFYILGSVCFLIGSILGAIEK